MEPGTVGRAWAVLSIRHVLRDEKNVLAASHCCIFATKDAALVFAKRVQNLKRNWSINVAEVPIFSDPERAGLPEADVPFHDN